MTNDTDPVVVISARLATAILWTLCSAAALLTAGLVFIAF